MKFREHRGIYSDSIATVVEVVDRDALVRHCQQLLQPFDHRFEPAQLNVALYGPQPDARNGWNTHIVTVEGYGVMGFTDGPVA